MAVAVGRHFHLRLRLGATDLAGRALLAGFVLRVLSGGKQLACGCYRGFTLGDAKIFKAGLAVGACRATFAG